MGDAFLAPFVLWASSFAAQDSEPPQVPAPVPVGWEFSGNVFYSDPPGSEDRVTGILYADRGPLHLETRYNYEDFETGSAWVGANFSGGGDVRWEITPIAGAVFGRTAGVAPGYRASLAWWKLDLQSEGEYLFDPDDESSSFFYNWSELAFLPRPFVRLGIVAQRTQLTLEPAAWEGLGRALLAQGAFLESAWALHAGAVIAGDLVGAQKRLVEVAARAGDAGQPQNALKLYATLLAKYPQSQYADFVRANMKQEERKLGKS